MAEAAAAPPALSHGRVLRIALPIAVSNATAPMLCVLDTALLGPLGQAAPTGSVR